MAWYCNAGMALHGIKYLILRAAVVVDDANTAAQGHRYGHVGLRHRVHRGGHKGGAQRYFLASKTALMKQDTQTRLKSKRAHETRSSQTRLESKAKTKRMSTKHK